MRTEKWYQRRLAKYFNDHYHEIEEEAEFYADPGYDKWEFLIPETGLRVTLICHENGIVSEKWKWPEKEIQHTPTYLVFEFEVVKTRPLFHT